VRRYVLTAVAVALLAAGPAGAAPPRNGFKDPAGDWAVKSQDILDVRVSAVRIGKTPALRAVITLAAPYDGVAGYGVGVSPYTTCETWVLKASGIGGDRQDARLEHVLCGEPGRYYTTAHPSAPATVSVAGNTVTVTAPYAVGLKKGLRLRGASASASVMFAGVWVVNLDGSTFVGSGDIGYGEIDVTLR
jgi:hypothetical protein